MKKLSILDTLIKLDGVLSLNNIMDIVFRSIGWYIVRFCSWLLDGVYKISDEIYSLLKFTKSSQIAELMGDYMFLIKILFGLSITFLGIYLIVKKVDNSMNISQNLLLILLVVVCMPAISTKMYAMTNASINYAKDTYVSEKSVAKTVIANNIIDFKVVDDKYAIDDKGMSKKCTEKNLTENRAKFNNVKKIPKGRNPVTYIDINETMDPDDDELKSGIWEEKLVGDAKGADKTTELNDGIFQYDERYFRYSVSWGTLIFTLIATTVGLVFTSFKIARLIFEIAWTEMLAPFFAATDIHSGQRIKALLTNLVSMFAALFLIAAMLGLYFMSVSWLNGQQKRISDLAYIVALLAVTWLLIDGPNIVEKIIGVDAGLQSGYKAAMATYMGIKTGVKGVKTGAKFGMAAGSGASSVADTLVRGKKGADGQRHGGIVGAAKAYKEGMKDLSLQSPSYNERIANNEQSSKDGQNNSINNGESDLKETINPSGERNIGNSENPQGVINNVESSKGISSEQTISENSHEDTGIHSLEENGGESIPSTHSPIEEPNSDVREHNNLEEIPKDKNELNSMEKPSTSFNGKSNLETNETKIGEKDLRKNNLQLATKGMKYSAPIPKNLSGIKNFNSNKEVLISDPTRNPIKPPNTPIQIKNDKGLKPSEKLKKNSILNKK